MKEQQVQPCWVRRAWLLAVMSAALAATAAPSGRTQEATDLYQATAIVTGTDMRSRPSGFAQCLREVLVKVSGETRLYSDPRVSHLAAGADALVASFSYVDPRAGVRPHDDQGTYDRSYDLTVRFDPLRIDKALAELGEQPWRGERPVVVPVLAVRGFAPPYTRTYLLSAEAPDGAVQRASFANSARKFGVTVRFPAQAELAAWGITADRFPSIPAASSLNEALVPGTLEFRPEAMGWVGSWRMRWHGVDHAWGISGVGFDQAFDDLLGGAVRLASGHDAPN